MEKEKKTTEEVIGEINRELKRLTRKLHNSDKGGTTALVIGMCYHDGEQYISDATWCGARSSAIYALRTLLVKSGKMTDKACVKAVNWMDKHPEWTEGTKGYFTDKEKFEEE